MKRVLFLFIVLLLGLAGLLVVRTITFRSRQPAVSSVAPESFDSLALAGRLAGALRFATISSQDSSAFDAQVFEGFQRYLADSFPKVHATLKHERVNGYGLLYEWTGSDSTLAPVVLLAHQDVVPIEGGTEQKWTQPPFAGVIANGYVWGRGAIDDKVAPGGVLEARR